MARIVGKGGAVYLVATGGTLAKVGDVYDWALDVTTTLLPADIKGDISARSVASHYGGKFTAKRRVNTSAVGFNHPGLLDFRLDLIDANSAFTQVSGSGYISQNGLAAPRGAADDTFELTIDGDFTMTFPGGS